jgi:hypothetical protein
LTGNYSYLRNKSVHLKLRILLLLLAFVSCKRDRTCFCTITRQGTDTTISSTAGLPPIVNASSDTAAGIISESFTAATVYNNISMSDMRVTCSAYHEEPFRENTQTVGPGLYTVTVHNAGTKKQECGIY